MQVDNTQELPTRRQILKDLQSDGALMNSTNVNTPGIPKAVTFEDEKGASPSSLLSDDTRSLPELPSSQWAMMELNTTIDVDVGGSTIFSPVSKGIFDTPAGHRTTGSLDSSSLVLESTTPFNVFRQNSTNIALDESQAYLERIGDLESKLKVPGTPAQPSTIQMLWERNETLVKEIRFADTTCVELSNKTQQLLQTVRSLESQNEQFRAEKQQLKESLETSEQNNNDLSNKVDELTAQLRAANESKVSMKELHEKEKDDWENQQQISKENLESANRETERLKMKLAEARQELQKQASASEEALEEMKILLKQKKSENDFLQSQLESQARSAKADMESLFETAKSQLDHLNDSAGSRQSSLSARLDHSNANLQLLSTQLQFEADNHVSGATTPSHTIPSIPTEALNLTHSQSVPTESLDSQSIPTQSLDMTPIVNNSPKMKQSMNTLEGFEGYSLLSDESASEKSSDNYKQTSEFGQHLKWMASPTPFFQQQQQHQHTNNASESVGSASELTSEDGGVTFLEQELEDVQTQLTVMTKERDALAAQIESMALLEINGSKNQSDLHDRLQSLYLEKQKLELELADKSESLEAALTSLADLKTKLLVKDDASLELQLQSTLREKDALEERLKFVSLRLEETERLLAEARTENKQIKSMLSTKSHSMDDLRRNMDLLQAEKDALSLKVDVRTKDCRALQKGLAYYQAPATDCKGAVKRKKRFKPWAKKEHKVRVKTPRKVIMSPDPKSPGSYESRALLERIASLENEIRTLTANQIGTKDIRAELSQTKTTLEAVSLERDSLREQIKKLRNTFGDDLKAVQQAYDQLQVSHTACEERLLSESAALLDAQKENDRLVSQLESALDNSSNKEELEKHGQELRDFRMELQSCRDKIESYETELREAHAAHEIDREQLLERLSESKAGYEQLLNDYEKLREQLKASTRKVSSSDNENKSEKTGDVLDDQTTNKVSDARRAEQCFREALQKLESTRSHRDALMHNLEDLSDRLGQSTELRFPNHRVTKQGMKGNELVGLELTKATECLNRMLAIESELSEVENLLQVSGCEARDLRERNESLSLKCGRLKDYIRKLTKKCDEWEIFHQREAEVLRKLKIANDRTREKALELAQRYQQRDVLYTVEKQKVNALQNERRQLEGELVDIAKELSNVRVNV